MNFVLILTLLFSASVSVKGKKVLGIYTHPGRSHQIIGETILVNLARRGHNITMISAFPLKEPVPNYTELYLDGFKDEISSDDDIYLKMEKNTALNLIGALHLANHFTDRAFSHPVIRKLINSGQIFDLIIMDWFLKDAELFYGYIFQAPVIVTSSFGTQAQVNYLVNNPEPYAYVPGSGYNYTDDMTFIDRVGNTIGMLYIDVLVFLNRILQQRILDSHFENAPRLDEMRDNVALVFSNAHPVFETPRPYLPNVISVGGLHIQEPEPLPQDLKSYLDAATNGFIYFSLGSHMKTSALPQTLLASILRAFSKIPQRVLLKWERDDIPDIPGNVRLGKWFPQWSVFAHPNIKGFITHGGLQSKIEAIHFAVPMIGIPLFGDQKTNVAHSVKEGIAVEVAFRELSEEALYNAINKIVNNTR
ncbi:hypothetical protein NQ318_018607 [Aromia moschata]|uniref:UDP-glucuronosyltransferase n=1 Tax=Aromia moschata TaxID=1265417 RepID=A0AAV8ZI13_9CUCU|nr:hypothetical protein NQ318_018607 [Aromia moschata]